MKDILTEAIAKNLSATLEALGGAKALYGDPITFDGEQIMPVAKLSVVLSSGAEGSGSGGAGITARITSLAKGGGGGNAESSVRIAFEPIGYLRSTPDGPVFRALEPERG